MCLCDRVRVWECVGVSDRVHMLECVCVCVCVCVYVSGSLAVSGEMSE